jgi:hypothetical protein
MDDREQFLKYMHWMRDAFCDARDVRDWDDRERLTGKFFGGYARVKRIFGSTLLRVEITGEPQAWQSWLISPN